MTEKSELAEILALRPQEETIEGYEAAIAAVSAKAEEYANRAREAQDLRAGSLLSLSAARLVGLEQEAARLTLAAEQAAELRVQLEVRLGEIHAGEADAAWRRRGDALSRQSADFARRFGEEYPGIVSAFLALAAEHRELVETIVRFNREAPADHHVETRPIDPRLIERTMLPSPTLEPDGYRSLAHAGSWWRPAHFEQRPGLRLPSPEAGQKHPAIAAMEAEKAAGPREFRLGSPQHMDVIGPGSFDNWERKAGSGIG